LAFDLKWRNRMDASSRFVVRLKYQGRILGSAVVMLCPDSDAQGRMVESSHQSPSLETRVIAEKHFRGLLDDSSQ
jgi:hypothetical protein